MSGIESTGHMNHLRLFTVTAMMELGAGVALFMAPSIAINLVSDFPTSEAGVAMGRLAGAALLSIGATCWLARVDGGSAASRALVAGLLIYNTAVLALILASTFGSPGPVLWAIAVLHAAMALWCLSSLRVAGQGSRERWRGSEGR
jgi:hypothetical protein